MTIQIIRRASLGLAAGTIRTLAPATEAALVLDGEAIYTTVPNPAGDDLPVRFDPTAGMIVMSDGGPIAAQVALQGMVSGDVKAYGAKADLVCLQVIQVTAGSIIADSTDAAFTISDVGKIFCVTGAGASTGASPVDGVTLYGPHVTTIARVLNATRIEMAQPAVRSVYTGSDTGIQHVTTAGTTGEAGAKAYYGSDDTAAIQAAVDDLHPREGVVLVPGGGCMVLGTVYCQTSRDTSGRGLLYRRLEFRGLGPTVRPGNSGAASQYGSNLFKPTAGAILSVNLNAAGEGMTSTGSVGTHQFFNFNASGVSFAGLPGNNTVGLKLHRVRANLKDVAFLSLANGFDGLSPDVNGAPNYCDMWYMRNVHFGNCAKMYSLKDSDSSHFDGIVAQTHYPTVTSAIELYGGRGWKFTAPLVNSLPATGKVGTFTYCKGGSVKNGHFEMLFGAGFEVIGSNSNSWVEFEACDFFNPAAAAGIAANTITFTSASGKVEYCGFAHNRASGYDIYFGAGRHQAERNNHFFEADNSTRRRPSVGITMGASSIGTTFKQQIYVNIVFNGTSFDVRNTSGSSVWPEHFSTQPGISGGNLRLDGSAKWGPVTSAIPVRKAGKYTPIVLSVVPLVISFYDDSNTKITVPDSNMDFWLLVM